jgi:hypothetical protein
MVEIMKKGPGDDVKLYLHEILLISLWQGVAETGPSAFPLGAWCHPILNPSQGFRILRHETAEARLPLLCLRTNGTSFVEI